MEDTRNEQLCETHLQYKKRKNEKGEREPFRQKAVLRLKSRDGVQDAFKKILNFLILRLKIAVLNEREPKNEAKRVASFTRNSFTWEKKWF